MNWSPNMNQGQAPQNAAQPQGAPQGGPPGMTQGGPPQGYGAPQPAPVGGGYAGPGAGGPQGSSAGAPAFSFGTPNLNESGPELPYGDHVLEVAGPREFVGQGSNMLVLPMRVKQTNNSQVPPGTPGTWKRYLATGHRANNDMVTNEIARLVVPLSGRHKDKCTPQEALALVQEFWQNGTLDGKPVTGMCVGATCSPSDKPDRNGKIHTRSIFHTL